jgi:CheY-like chemotaxis protein
LFSDDYKSRLKIAVVDDEKDLTDLYCKILRRLGYPAPSVFFDGSTLVEAVANEKQSFDLILLDYKMKQMDGIEAAKIVSTYNKNSRIVLVTAYDSLRERAAALGLLFIAKPFSVKQFSDLLSSIDFEISVPPAIETISKKNSNENSSQ